MKIVVKRQRTFAVLGVRFTPEVGTSNKYCRLVSSVVYLPLHVWEALDEFLVCVWF